MSNNSECKCDYLIEDLIDSVNNSILNKDNALFNKYMTYVCSHLRELSPEDNKWYYDKSGFIKVDVKKNQYDDYLNFIEQLVGCKYTHTIKDNCLTLMFTVSTLQRCFLNEL